ncbi:methyltransferase [Candidatus Micrarchaeota archaeon]|nr:methyltransferase [Candidatus Micrarchaeota archaeon]
MIDKEYLVHNIKNCKDVYPPADDSFLLMDSIEKIKLDGSEKCLDICCGTGIVGIYASNFVKTIAFLDKMKHALICAKKNTKFFGVSGNFIESDLFDKIDEKYDLILFNPPYLPTDESSKIKGKLNEALDGGKTGRNVIDRFIETFSDHLTEKGQVLMVDSSLDNTNKTIKKLKSKGFLVEIVDSKSFFFEKLSIIWVKKVV